jgi:hypothetical protein
MGGLVLLACALVSRWLVVTDNVGVSDAARARIETIYLCSIAVAGVRALMARRRSPSIAACRRRPVAGHRERGVK